MALFKVPILLLLTTGFNVILTPPHRTPPREEILQSTAIDIASVRNYRLAFARAGQTILACAEIVAIIAQTFPTSPISQYALSILFLSGNQDAKIGLNWASALGAILWSLGTTLRLNAFQNLGRFFHFDLSIQKEHKLIVTGPYAYVRHPSYSGLLLTMVGWFLWHGAKGSWVRESGILDTKIGAAIFVAYVVIGILPANIIPLSRMSREDEILRRQFGAEWDNWAKRVPYFIIPGIY